MKRCGYCGDDHKLRDCERRIEESRKLSAGRLVERDAFELGPDGSVGLRLVDGFALEEGRT